MCSRWRIDAGFRWGGIACEHHAWLRAGLCCAVLVFVVTKSGFAANQTATMVAPAAPVVRPTSAPETSNAPASSNSPVLLSGPTLPAPEIIPPSVPEQRLSLEELEQMALFNNPSVARLAALVNAARGNWVQAGLPPNPSVGYEGQQLGSGGLAEQHGVVFSQEVVRGGKLRLSRAVADQELARARHELATQQQRVLTDVRVAYYEALLAQRRIDVTSELVRISLEGTRTVEGLFRAQEASRADVLQAQIEFENAEILATNARHRHLAAWQTLTAVVGNALIPCQPLAGDAFVPPACFNYDETLARIQMASPEIAVAMAEIDRNRNALARARVEPVPNVSFQGLVNVVDNGIFGGKPDGGVMVTVPIPVFNRNQGAISRAQGELVASQQGLGQLQLDLKNRLAPTFERYANARYQVERYQTRLLPAAKETLDLTRRTYEAGETGYLGLLTAQRTYFQTNINYLEAVRDLRVSESLLDGLLLSGSLEAR